MLRYWRIRRNPNPRLMILHLTSAAIGQIGTPGAQDRFTKHVHADLKPVSRATLVAMIVSLLTERARGLAAAHLEPAVRDAMATLEEDLAALSREEDGQ